MTTDQRPRMTREQAISRYTPPGLAADECWPWKGSRTPDGYGQVELQEDGRRKNWPAHRLAHFLATGELPEQVHHRCGNKPCVNPVHLVGLTLREHQAEHHGADVCIRGHDLTDVVNVYQRPDGKGRQCRPCFAVRIRERRAAAHLGVRAGDTDD